MRRLSRKVLIITTCLAILAIGAGYVAVQIIVGAIPPSETTDVEEYDSVLQQWLPSGLVGHFPASIPPRATNIRFSAFPGYMQGGAHIQLRMQLPSEEIKQIEDQLRRVAIHVYTGGDFFDHYNRDQKNNVPTTSFHTAADPAHTYGFPAHCTLYVLQAKPGGESWNHGKTSGTAVSDAANEVIYWAETW